MRCKQLTRISSVKFGSKMATSSRLASVALAVRQRVQPASAQDPLQVWGFCLGLSFDPLRREPAMWLGGRGVLMFLSTANRAFLCDSCGRHGSISGIARGTQRTLVQSVKMDP